jgi:LysM repeat protein
MKKIVTLIVICLLVIKISVAQSSQVITPEQYIATYKDIAIREMKRMGVPAAITLAQGLLETVNGNSDLVKQSNNHFGIKCKDTWTAGGVRHDDDSKGECFRHYNSAEDSYRDHSNFLRGSDRYAFLFRLDPLDYKGWAYGLKKAGYATNPMYPQILINNIEQYDLQQYSLIAAKDVPKVDPSQYKDDPETPDTDLSDLSMNNTPGKISSINGTKYLFAAKGTSLLAIATNNNIDLSKLLDYNDLNSDGILQKDQIIFLQKKQKTGEEDTYIVKQGESLYDIAQLNGIQLGSLIEYNQLSAASKVLPGTTLYLKPIETNSSTINLQDRSANITFHNVQPKEGLYSIAKAYGITVDQLRQWNNLTGDQLQIGQQLIVRQQ